MDPLSISAGAAGFLSLGITATKGVIDFCHDYRAQDGDIDDLLNKAKRLERLATLANDRLQKDPGPDDDLRNVLTECFRATHDCTGSVKQLNAKLNHRTDRPNGKSRLRRLGYPFKDKKRISDLSIQITEFQSALAMYLQLMNLDQSRAFHNATIQNANALSHQVASEGQRLSKQISHTMPHGSMALNEAFDRIDSSFQQGIQALEAAVISVTQQNQRSIREYDHKFDQMNTGEHESLLSGRNRVTDMSLEPELEQTPQDLYHRDDMILSSQSDDRIDQELFEDSYENACMNSLYESTCCCRHRTTQRDRGIPSQWGGHYSYHELSCPLSITERVEYGRTERLRLFKYLFTCKLAVSYSRHAFLRSLQVERNLTIQAVVPVEDNAAIHQITLTCLEIGQLNEPFKIIQTLDICIREIENLFLERKAWPTDIDEYGHNLLSWPFLFLPWYPNIFRNRQSTQAWIRFVRKLSSFTTAPMSIDLMFFSDYFSHWSTQDPEPTFQTNIMEATKGAFRANVEIGTFEYPSALTYILHCGAGEQFLDYGPISSALFRREEYSLVHLLQRSPDLMAEIGLTGETPLHIGAVWPRGLNLLFELAPEQAVPMLDMANRTNETALCYALKAGQIESVKALLQAGALFRWRDLESLYESLHFDRNRLCRIIAQDLASRARQLRIWAEGLLTPMATAKFLNKDQGLLHDTSAVLEALQQVEVELPTRFAESLPRSPYHFPFMRVELAQALFEAGFDSVDTEFRGLTPLTVASIPTDGDETEFMDRVQWLIAHGADLYRPMSWLRAASRCLPEGRQEYMPIHRLAAITVLGSCYNPTNRFLSVADLLRKLKTPPLLPSILSESCNDPCICYCSQNGCIPASISMRHFLGELYQEAPDWQWTWPWEKEEYGIKVCVSLFQDQQEYVSFPDTTNIWISLVYHATTCAASSTAMALSVAQCITFDRLGMRHTCCTWSILRSAFRTEYILDGEDSPVRFGDSQAETKDLGRDSNYLVSIMEPSEITEIQEEDRYLAEDLEGLMEEFEVKLQEEAMTFSDFFFEYWLDRMEEYEARKDYISPTQESAIRDLGVALKKD